MLTYISTLQLSSLDPLFTNQNYKQLANFDFSGNLISSVNGTALLEYFTARSYDIKLNLRNNNLYTVCVN